MKKYFKYQDEVPDKIYKTKNGKGIHSLYQWGNNLHYNGEKWNRSEIRNIRFDIKNFREKLFSWIEDELKDDFSTEELKLIRERDNSILDRLLSQWRSSYDISIYHDKYYIFETINCGIFVTGKINKGDISHIGLGSPIFNSLDYLLSLGYQPKTILDFGSGIGMSSIFYSLIFPQSQIYIIEENPHSVKIIKRLIKELNLTNIHFGDKLENYDCGLFFESVEHIKDLSRDSENIGSPFPFMNNYFNRINDLIVQSSYWKKNRTSIGIRIQIH
jgi:tRNA G26 N,N-dimethylase Trm1